MLNKVMIIGRLGRDPELKYSQSGMAMCNLNVATDESYTDREGQRVDRTEWHRIVVFQRSAENCNAYLHKGSLIFAEGSLQTRKWQDQQGQDRYTTEIKATRVQFLDRKGDNLGGSAPEGDYAAGPAGGAPAGGSGPAGGAPRQAPPRRQAPARQPQPSSEDYGPAFPSEAPAIDELPF